MIYYGDAIMADGTSVAVKINPQNNDRLRWVTNYSGHFNSTNITFADGTTYSFNAALVQSRIDPNFFTVCPDAVHRTTPVFYAHQPGPRHNDDQQASCGRRCSAANDRAVTSPIIVFYKTNLMMTNWLTLTNFITPASPAWPPVPVMMSDPVSGPMRAYRVRVDVKH